MSVVLSQRFGAEETVPTEASVLVVLRTAGGSLGPHGAALDRQTGGAITRACGAPRYSGAVGECVDILAPAGLSARRIIVLGLGETAALTPLAATRAGTALAKHLETEAETAAAILFDAPPAAPATPADLLARLVLGLRLAHYRFAMMPRSEIPRDLAVTVIADGVDPEPLRRCDALAEGVALARTLVNLPASHLNPDTFVAHLAPLQEAGIEVQVLEPSDLERLGMNAVLAVGNGSARPPRVITLRYRGPGSSGQPLALVGKGICFDSGGLCIKSGPQMFTMKADMGGAAAVIGTMLALARQGAPVHVAGVLGVAENMVSATSYKPGDIVTTMSGRTVEVYDTDCEGRMVLADILHYAATRFQPRAIVDLATLTYSVMRGLGHVFAGLFATHDALAEGLAGAGETVGERLWRLPLDAAYDEGLRSAVADLRQHARDLEDGDAPYAAAFLRNFSEGCPWAHLDIAGKEYIDHDRPLARAGASGFGVQLLEEWITGLGPDLERL